MRAPPSLKQLGFFLMSYAQYKRQRLVAIVLHSVLEFASSGGAKDACNATAVQKGVSKELTAKGEMKSLIACLFKWRVGSKSFHVARAVSCKKISSFKTQDHKREELNERLRIPRPSMENRGQNRASAAQRPQCTCLPAARMHEQELLAKECDFTESTSSTNLA